MPVVEDRSISNLLVLGRELNVVQPESDPVITSSRTARGSREVQYHAQQQGVARVRALRRRQHKLDDLVNIAEAIRLGAPACDVNGHLNYVTAIGIDVGIVIMNT